MKSSLTKGMDKMEAAEMRSSFLAAHRVRERLIEMLNEKNESLVQSMLNEDIDEGEAWALSQVQKLAEMKANKKLISLLQN